MNRSLLIVNMLLLFLSPDITAQEAKGIYASSSVLSRGRWFRIAVTSDGIYRIDFDDLRKAGLEDPSMPRLFGNNAGQLSYYNDNSGPDDLKEISILTFTGDDGVFNEGDYLLFYGQSTHRWIYNKTTHDFDFLRHNYSDTAFYFITSGNGPSKKIISAREPSSAANIHSEVSDVLYSHEIEADNLLHSGREWYQPVPGIKATDADPSFTGILTDEPAHFSVRVLARASSPTAFRFYSDGSLIKTIPVGNVDVTSSTGTYASLASSSGSFYLLSSSPQFSIEYDNGGDISARAWLDYVRIHARKRNLYDGNAAIFRDTATVGAGNITEFSFRSTGGSPIIWDITDPYNIESAQCHTSGDNITFTSVTDSLRTFIAFDPGKSKKALINPNPLPSQDLHASDPADMLIITHPWFYRYALQIADIHNTNNGLKSMVVTPGQIYNEFSGGIPDIAAIRNFIRMKYIKQKGTTTPLRFVLLLGDGSYENKTPPPGNTNFILTYQSQNSNVVVSSFTSDDFYTLLDDGEGEDVGTEDVGIGRIPVSDTGEAAVIVSKISGYLSPSNTGSWKNTVCLAADDEDGNVHMTDAEGLSSLLAESAPWINVDKIYFDAFPQTTTSTGQFYPDVTRAINDRINSGALIFDYIGHGNENSLAHERVVTMESIGQWKNKSRLPLFITATCEFSRFDDITIDNITGLMSGKNSAGEKTLLSSDGGAVALMSTTRLVYAAPNYTLDRNILKTAFETDTGGKALCLGDIIKRAKNISGNGTNKRNFVLLGDPALMLDYPWHGNVVTDSVKTMPEGTGSDTLRALSLIRIAGHVEDPGGNPETNFNGNVIPVVFGKAVLQKTLANDGGQKMEFYQQNNVLFSGSTIAHNGSFSFEFIVPRDIDYNYGKGKISYYASDLNADMKGFCNITVGGFSNETVPDTTGPAIRLFLNDTLFRNGGMTDSDPIIYAILEDTGGINTTGTGIGHDISCYIDEDRTNTIVLNNYYENYAETYSKGRVLYRLNGLKSGKHTLTLKAWDNFNNSSEKTLDFSVETGDKFILKDPVNYPNPFGAITNFSVSHNRPDQNLEIRIDIFSLSGKPVRIIRTSRFSSGYQLQPVEWDGCGPDGNRIAAGLYPYRMTIRTENGEISTISGRLIIL